MSREVFKWEVERININDSSKEYVLRGLNFTIKPIEPSLDRIVYEFISKHFEDNQWIRNRHGLMSKATYCYPLTWLFGFVLTFFLSYIFIFSLAAALSILIIIGLAVRHRYRMIQFYLENHGKDVSVSAYEHYSRPFRRFWIVKTGSNVFGTFALDREDPNDDTLEFKRFIIAPRYRGLGLGRFIMAYAEIAARQMNCSAITLVTLRTNRVAQNLYKSIGFYHTHVTIYKERWFIPLPSPLISHDELWMRKELITFEPTVNNEP